MKTRRICILGVVGLGLCLVLLVGWTAQAQLSVRSAFQGAGPYGELAPWDALGPEVPQEPVIPEVPRGPQVPLGAAFTYQGYLTADGNPTNGPCDLTFKLYDTAGAGTPPSGGNQIGATEERTGVLLTHGRFTVPDLDFGQNAFTGEARWLEIAVKCAGDSTYSTLGRQALTAAPYALSLRPGAIISGTVADGNSLSVYNSGSEGYGVYVGSAGADGVWVNQAADDGFYVSSAGDVGVYVGSAGNHGVHVNSAGDKGVYVNSAGNYGVYSLAGSGVTTRTNAGVYGRSSSSDGYGVAGHNYWGGVGVAAWSYSGNLIEAYGGDYPLGDRRFYVTQSGDVFADGGFNTFMAASTTDGTGTTGRALTAIQSPEAWFEDFGSGRLVGGAALVQVEPTFAQLVNLAKTYHVFLTPLCDAPLVLYVTQKGAESFTVRGVDLSGQPAECGFDYRIVAKRLGYEHVRLEVLDIPAPGAVNRETGRAEPSQGQLQP